MVMSRGSLTGAHSNFHRHWPKRRTNFISFVVFCRLWLLCVLIGLFGGRPAVLSADASAPPVMAISSSMVQQDYWPANPGLETRFLYNVRNTSDFGDHHNMIDLTLPAGSNQGVFDAVSPSGWSVTIDPDSTHFLGNGAFIAPSGSGIFELYSTDLNRHQGYANAAALGDGVHVPFTPVQTDVPGDSPCTLSADIDMNGRVDFQDFAVMAARWQEVSYSDVDFGMVHTQFVLGGPGYDTAGGSDPNENFFHTESGIEVRDKEGKLLEKILLPDQNIYGVAFDGSNLSVSSFGGSIYTFDGSLWNAGLGTNEAGARGLGASATDFYLVVDDGANIARIDKITGATLDTYAIDEILGEGLGLDYIPLTNELIVTNGTDNIYRLKLNEGNMIDSYSSIRSSNSLDLYGVGFNLANGNLVLNNSTDTGQYADGIIPAPATGDITGNGIVNFEDLVELSEQWLNTENGYIP